MSMKLHAHKVSTTSRPVLMFIADNKIDAELVVVDLMTGEHVKEPYSKLNPSKQVPLLVDGDFMLTESSAILKYLADKIGSPAYPKDLKKRAKVNEMMDWLNTGFYREWGYHLIYPQIYPHHKRPTEESNRITAEWGKTQSEFWLGVLNDHWLGKGNKYLCGDDLTIADYFGAGIVTAGELAHVNFGKYPNIKKWIDRVKAFPCWAQVNDVHNGYAASLKGKVPVTIS
jgi:glutathione S-transferase